MTVEGLNFLVNFVASTLKKGRSLLYDPFRRPKCRFNGITKRTTGRSGSSRSPCRHAARRPWVRQCRGHGPLAGARAEPRPGTGRQTFSAPWGLRARAWLPSQRGADRSARSRLSVSRLASVVGAGSPSRRGTGSLRAVRPGLGHRALGRPRPRLGRYVCAAARVGPGRGGRRGAGPGRQRAGVAGGRSGASSPSSAAAGARASRVDGPGARAGAAGGRRGAGRGRMDGAARRGEAVGRRGVSGDGLKVKESEISFWSSRQNEGEPEAPGEGSTASARATREEGAEEGARRGGERGEARRAPARVAGGGPRRTTEARAREETAVASASAGRGRGAPARARRGHGAGAGRPRPVPLAHERRRSAPPLHVAGARALGRGREGTNGEPHEEDARGGPDVLFRRICRTEKDDGLSAVDAGGQSKEGGPTAWEGRICRV